MRSTSSLLPRALAALLLIAAGACTRAVTSPAPSVPIPVETPPPLALSSEARATPSAPSVAPPLPAPTQAATMAAWTDPAPLAELAKSCAWAPIDPSPEDPGPLSCQVHFEQTCNPIGCDIDYQDRCLPACKATCEGCAQACRKTCTACAAPCTEGDCRSGCAATTGACLQGCLKEEDHCATATCNTAFDACYKDYAAAFEKSKCERLRPKFSACVEACVEHPPRDVLREESEFMRGHACQNRCVTSVLGATCGPFLANFRIF